MPPGRTRLLPPLRTPRAPRPWPRLGSTLALALLAGAQPVTSCAQTVITTNTTYQNAGGTNLGDTEVRDGATLAVANNGGINTGQLLVGGNSAGTAGTLSVGTGGDVVSTGIVRIGYTGGATASAVIDGAGSTFSATGSYIEAGYAGTGSLTLTNGASVSTVSSVAAGVLAGSNGTVTIGGAGSTLTTGTFLYAGYLGTGTLTINSGAAVTVATELALGVLGGGSGTLNLNGGTLNLGGTNALRIGSGSGSVNFAGGTLRATTALTSSVPIALATSTTSTLDTNGFATTLSGVLSGSGALTKSGAGTLTLTGAGSTFGAFDLSRGGLSLTSGGTLSAASMVAHDDNGSPVSISLTGAGSALTVPGELQFGAGTITVGSGGTLSVGSLSLFAGRPNGTPFDPDNPITSSFVVDAGGTLTLAGAINANSGRTLTFNGGTFSLGPGAANDASTSVTAGATVTVDVASGTATAGFAGPGSLLKTGAGTLDLNNLGLAAVTIQSGTLRTTIGRNVVVSTPYAIGTGGTLEFSGGTGSSTQSGILSGEGRLIRSGNGTTFLTAANTYTGGTTVVSGGLQVGAGGTAGSIVGNVAVSAGSTFLIGRSDDLTFAGDITGAGAFAKVAANTLTLTGHLGVTGAVHLGGGTLILDRGATSYSLAAPFTDVGHWTKAGSGTLTLTGNSTATGTTTLAAGAINLGGGGATGTLAGTINLGAGTTLTFDHSGNLSVGAAFTGAGSLAKTGSNTLTLTGSLGHTGGVALGGGTLVLDRGATSYALANTLTGGGALAKQGAGTLTLTADNTFSGATTVSAGTLSLGAGGTAGGIAGPIAIASGATLAVNRSSDLGLSALISGSGSLAKLGSGALVLTADNSFSGTTTISSGALHLGNGGASGSLAGPIAIDAGATLVLNRASNLTLVQAISGSGALTKLGGGTLFLTGNNTFTGGVTLSAGTLYVGNGGASGSLVANLATGANTSVFFSSTGHHTYPGVISGAGAVLKFSSGTLTLSGDNTNTDALAIYQGRVNLGSGGSTGSYSASIDIASGAVLGVDRSTNLQLSQVISGAGSLVKEGPGTLVLSGNNTFTGAIALNGGALQIGAGSASGAIVSGNIAAAAGTTLIFDHTFSNRTYAGAMSGAGALEKRGTIALTLTGAHTYTGGTTVSGGALLVAGAGSITGDVAVAQNASLSLEMNGGGTFAGAISGGGLLRVATGSPLTLTGPITVTGGIELGPGVTLDRGSTSYTLAAPLNGGGTLTKLGSGTLTLTANGNYSGTVHVSAGALNLGGGGPAGAFAGTINVATGAGVTFDHSVDFDLTSRFTGAGALTKVGANTLQLGADSTATGLLTISAGRVNLGHGFGTGTYGGPIEIAGGAVLGFNRTTDVGLGNAISGAGSLVKANANVLTLAGTNTFTGGTTITGGTLAVSSNANLGGAGGALTFGGGTLRATSSFAAARPTTLGAGGGTFDVGTDVTLQWDGNISGAAGNSLTKTGAGVLLLGGNNTYSGDTLVNEGALHIGTAAALSPNSKLTVAPGAMFNANGHQPTFADLGGSGSLQLGSAGLIVQPSGASTFSGTLSGAGGFTLRGSGVLTLAGTNTHTGPTQITGGRLHLTGSAASSPFTLSGGGKLSGTGTIGPLTIDNGGRLAPGSSPGTLNSGSATWNSGGTYEWEINRAGGTAGTNWDLLNITGTLNIASTSGSTFTISLISLTPGNAAGSVIDFSSGSNYSFTFATASGGISGFSADAFALNTSAFQNSFNGAWSIAQIGNNLALNYTASAIPEPGTYAVIAGAAALGLALWRRRRRTSH